MFPYWVIFFFPAILAAGEAARPPRRDVGAGTPKAAGPLWISFVTLLALMVGLRWEVGGDWGNYLSNYYQIVGVFESVGFNLSEILSRTHLDPSYVLLNIASHAIGWGVVGVNFVCGVIFCIGLGRFCLSLPRPWLAMTVAVPYMIIVVGMGYSRQAVALGCEMAGLVALSRGGVKSFIVWMLIGASFHKSAVVLLPIAALAGARNRLWTLLSGAAAAGVGFVLFLQKDAEDLYQNYVGAEYQSSGAAIRIAMNLVPATLVLLFGKRMQFPEGQGRIWFWFSVISFLLAGLLVVSPSSTAVDRIALYMLPLQLAGFAYLPNILPKKTISLLAIGPILFYYAAVQFVWLNFAVNAIMWLPYRFSLFRI